MLRQHSWLEYVSPITFLLFKFSFHFMVNGIYRLIYLSCFKKIK